MAHTLAIALTTLVVLLAGSEAQPNEAALVFTAFPSIVINNLTEKISIDCRFTEAIVDLKMALMMDILMEDETGSPSMIASLWSGQDATGRDDGKTKAEGSLQSKENSKSSTLSVTIQNPTFENEGVYSCRFLYMNSAYKLKQMKSLVNITVEAIPPPHYVPSSTATGGCGCDDVWLEINKLKAMMEAKKSIGKQADSPPIIPSGDGSCQVSFSANYKTQHGQPIMSDHHLLFNDVISNKGGAYSTETGIFTVPCDGQYYFTLSLRTQQEMDSGYVDGSIMADDIEMARTSVFIDSPINNIESATNGVVLSLKQGQKVKVVMKTTSFGQIMGSTYSIFTGFFLFH